MKKITIRLFALLLVVLMVVPVLFACGETTKETEKETEIQRGQKRLRSHFLPGRRRIAGSYNSVRCLQGDRFGRILQRD